MKPQAANASLEQGDKAGVVRGRSLAMSVPPIGRSHQTAHRPGPLLCGQERTLVWKVPRGMRRQPATPSPGQGGARGGRAAGGVAPASWAGWGCGCGGSASPGGAPGGCAGPSGALLRCKKLGITRVYRKTRWLRRAILGFPAAHRPGRLRIRKRRGRASRWAAAGMTPSCRSTTSPTRGDGGDSGLFGDRFSHCLLHGPPCRWPHRGAQARRADIAVHIDSWSSTRCRAAA